MDDKDWVILTNMDKRQSLSKLADDLYITQPTLTYRIKKMEIFFNTKLFHRNSSGFHPTLQGELIIQHAKKIVKGMTDLRENINLLDTKVTGTINIGVIRALSMYLLPELLSPFLFKYPDVKINIITGFSSDLMNDLANNHVHMVILREDIEWLYYKKCISSTNVSIFSKFPINFSELNTLPRINYKTNPSLKALIDNWWKNNFNESPNSIMEVDNSETCVEMVKSGIGYAILPEFSLEGDNQLFYYPLQDKQELLIKRETWIYCADEAKNYVAVREFIDFLNKYFMK